MDYFYWDDVFGPRSPIGEELLAAFEPLPDEPTVQPDLVAVVITWVKPGDRPGA